MKADLGEIFFCASFIFSKSLDFYPRYSFKASVSLYSVSTNGFKRRECASTSTHTLSMNIELFFLEEVEMLFLWFGVRVEEINIFLLFSLLNVYYFIK